MACLGSAFDGEENKAKISTAATEDSKVSSRGKKTSSERTNVNLGNSSGKSAAKGKVREFVKIFNQDTSANPRTNSEVPSQSSRWKDVDINGIQNEIRNVTKVEEKVCASNTQETPDASCKVLGNIPILT